MSEMKLVPIKLLAQQAKPGLPVFFLVLDCFMHSLACPAFARSNLSRPSSPPLVLSTLIGLGPSRLPIVMHQHHPRLSFFSSVFASNSHATMTFLLAGFNDIGSHRRIVSEAAVLRFVTKRGQGHPSRGTGALRAAYTAVAYPRVENRKCRNPEYRFGIIH
eukprot:769896-Pleurochrysis_carterae.AAC.2